MLDVTIEGGSAVFGANLNVEHGGHVRLFNSKVVGQRHDRWYVDGTRLELKNCVLAGLWIEAADVAPKGIPSVQAEVSAIQLDSCSGLIVLEADVQRYQQGSDDTVAKLRRTYPAITFLVAQELRNEIRRRDPKIARISRSREKQVGGDSSTIDSPDFGDDALHIFVERIRALECEAHFRDSWLWSSFQRVDAEVSSIK
jgi:hypothetical protein